METTCLSESGCDNKNTDYLEKAKKIIKKITGIEPYLDSLPTPQKDTENLRDKKIAVVDDQEATFTAFVLPLLVETNDNASFIPYLRQTKEEIVDELLGLDLDVILLDLNLSSSLKGIDIAKALTEGGFSGKMFGFSNDMRAKEEYSKVGAEIITKDLFHPDGSLRELSQLLSSPSSASVSGQ
jgi:hypothetical protein